jgi:hypothetical protein
MTHELKDSLVLLCTAIIAITAIVVPWLMNRDSKRSNQDTKQTLAIAWGKLTEKVDSNGERLERVETTVLEHSSDIGYLKGRVNGAAAGKVH